MRTSAMLALSTTALVGLLSLAWPRAGAARPEGATPKVGSQEEQQARRTYEELADRVVELSEVGSREEAVRQIDAFVERHGRTQAAREALHLRELVQVWDLPVPPLKPHKWLVGSPQDVDLEHGSTVVVFWEWPCQYYRQGLPRLQALLDRYAGRLKGLALTAPAGDVSEQELEGFLRQRKVRFPTVWEQGEATRESLQVEASPRAVVVQEGRVVWVGHPEDLREPVLKVLLGPL